MKLSEKFVGVLSDADHVFGKCCVKKSHGNSTLFAAVPQGREQWLNITGRLQRNTIQPQAE